MTAQLDILALEPFYGGARRAMLEAVIRCSRHRWTLLKLPPRRMERRLAAAANWFAEQLCRHFTGRIDLLFTSEAMNLANLLRLVPALAGRPSVVYFHDNHLPAMDARQQGPFDLVNLNTATAATEIWFNSEFHLKTFLGKAAALVARHPELAAHNPLATLAAKAMLVPPPMDLGLVEQVGADRKPDRARNTIFLDTRDADMKLLNGALELTAAVGRRPRLVAVGPVDRLCERLERMAIRELDEVAQVRGMLESSILLTARPEATFDYLFVRGMLAGCRPVAPNAGIYRELVPAQLHESCLSEPDPKALASKLAIALDATNWPIAPADWKRHFEPFNAMTASRAIDERLDELAGARVNAA